MTIVYGVAHHADGRTSFTVFDMDSPQPYTQYGTFATANEAAERVAEVSSQLLLFDTLEVTHDHP